MITFHRLSPVWPVPAEVARAVAPESMADRLRWLEMRGVTFRQTALMMVINGSLVAELQFDRPCEEGTTAVRYQTGVRLRENA